MGLFDTPNPKDEGKEATSKREVDPFRYGSDKGYKAGVDYREGEIKRSERDKENEKSPIAGPFFDALCGRDGWDTLGKSKEFEDGYYKRPSSKSHSCDSSGSGSGSSSGRSYGGGSNTGNSGGWIGWLIFLGLIFGIPSYIHYQKNKEAKPQTRKLGVQYPRVTRNSLENRINPEEERIKRSLTDWLKKNGKNKYDFTFRDYEKIGGEVWLVGSYFPALGDKGGIFHSSDIGRTWEIQWESKDFLWRKEYVGDPFTIQFINEKEGWAAGRGNILHTEDGGQNWKSIWTRGNFSEYLKKFRVIDRNSILAYNSKGDLIPINTRREKVQTDIKESTKTIISKTPQNNIRRSYLKTSPYSRIQNNYPITESYPKENYGVIMKPSYYPREFIIMEPSVLESNMIIRTSIRSNRFDRGYIVNDNNSDVKKSEVITGKPARRTYFRGTRYIRENQVTARGII